MYSKDKCDTSAIPSNSQAWEKLALHTDTHMYLEVYHKVSHYSPAEWTHTTRTSKHGWVNAENYSSKKNGAFRTTELWRCDETC
ncbi:hypothetical protein A6R68_13487 [Neotoma lepida]|uniref:Uncharacterized protein n=1 Tax=Neotoma lepida TaxID=56216 RepID=A0A1A6H023_NEOLE|nr:hypothetical protein A6R68_13487 [Neotoma lepida]